MIDYCQRFHIVKDMRLLFALLTLCISTSLFAETVNVKYRGDVDLAPFSCEWVSRSSVVNRLCYDSKEQYVIVKLKATYYHYCEVPASIIENWRNADSMGRYYNAQVKGLYDCRIYRAPKY